MTKAEILAAGGVPEAASAGMTKAEILAAGGKAVEEPAGPDAPGTTAGLNALDSLSVVGVPATLGMGNALAGIDSADPKSHAKFSLDNLNGLMDRYYKNKEFYRDGMDRFSKANPKSALLGQAAPILIPGGAALKGAGLGGTVARGAATGLLYGAARGDSKTLDGDVGGTVKDAAVGAGVGALTAGVGYGVGKLAAAPIKAISNAAGGAYKKILSDVAARSASKEGQFGKIQQMGQGAARNKVADIARAADTALPAEEQALGKEAVAYNQKSIDAAAANKAKWGHRAAPPRSELDAQHMKDIQGEAWQGAGDLAKKAAVVGGAAAVHPYAGALAAAVVGGGGNMRQAVQAAVKNPAVMSALMKLAPVQQAMARFGGKVGAQPEMINSVVYALKDHPEVKKVLDSAASEPVAAR